MAKLLLSILIFVTFTIYAIEATFTCPEDGKITPERDNGKCVWVMNVIVEPLSHDRAKKMCQEQGGQLPIVKSPQKEGVLRLLVKEKRATITTPASVDNDDDHGTPRSRNQDAVYVWINLQRDPLPDGANATDMTVWKQRESWKWKEDESIIGADMWRFWNQRDNEPNNYQQTDEYCVVAKEKGEGESTWNDATCANTRWYDGATQYPTFVICEKYI